MSCKNSIIKHVRRWQTQLADASGVPSEEDEEERGQRFAAVLNRREAEAIGGEHRSVRW